MRGGFREGSGRKKGKATLYAEALKGEIARLVVEDAKEMIAAQIRKALQGETPAFKELMDRTLGKSRESHDVNVTMVKPIYAGKSVQRYDGDPENLQPDEKD